jgi:hypothetical protein
VAFALLVVLALADRLAPAPQNFCPIKANSWHLNVQRLKQDSLDSLSWLWFEKAGDRVRKRARKESGLSPGKEATEG